MSCLPRRVLAIGAHPDDIELLCAGTLARFLQEGCDVHLAIACKGDKGGLEGSDLDLARRREAEARTAAAILGVPIDFLGFLDTSIRDTRRAREQFVRLLRAVGPELVLTHAPDDYHADHTAVADLAAKCSWFAASGGHASGSPPLEKPPTLVYFDNLAGVGCEPTHLVDITATFGVKRLMLACHESQLARHDGGIHDLVDLAETQARLRGFQCGVTYAEGFRPALLWGRRRPEPLLP